MKSKYLCLAAACVISLASVAQEKAPSSPVVELRTKSPVSSATAKVGDLVILETTKPVIFDGKLLIASGATARAKVTEVRHRGHANREGRVVFTVESVSTIEGNEMSLHPARLWQGTGKRQPLFGPCSFPIPADPVGLFHKGKDVEIPAGTVFSVAVVNPDTPASS